MIPEEPVSGSPIATTEIRRRSPSPDWDFDEEDKTVMINGLLSLFPRQDIDLFVGDYNSFPPNDRITGAVSP